MIKISIKQLNSVIECAYTEYGDRSIRRLAFNSEATYFMNAHEQAIAWRFESFPIEVQIQKLRDGNYLEEHNE